MVKSTSRRGRPEAVFRPKLGDQVVGLMRLGDGRWRASGPEKYTFSEADESLAIARFYEWKSQKNHTDQIAIPVAIARVDDLAAVADAIKFVNPPVTDTRSPDDQVVDYLLRTTATSPATFGTRLNLTDDGMLEWHRETTQSAAFWAIVRRLIINSPKLCAERTGIEQLAYLADLKAPSNQLSEPP